MNPRELVETACTSWPPGVGDGRSHKKISVEGETGVDTRDVSYAI